jgi:hypothetical protein
MGPAALQPQAPEAASGKWCHPFFVHSILPVSFIPGLMYPSEYPAAVQVLVAIRFVSPRGEPVCHEMPVSLLMVMIVLT